MGKVRKQREKHRTLNTETQKHKGGKGEILIGKVRESRETNTAATLIYDEQFESEFRNVDSANIQDVSKQ